MIQISSGSMMIEDGDGQLLRRSWNDPSKWFASVTNILSAVVHEKLKKWLRENT